MKAEIQKVEATATQLAVMAEMDEEGFAGFEFLPERIKFGSGGLLAFQTSDGGVMASPIDAVVAIAQKVRAVWPSKDTAGLPPLCSSADGVTGHFDVDSPQVSDALRMEARHLALDTVDKEAAAGPWACAECPLAQFGSGPNGSQSCKALRRLVIVPQGWAAPGILTLPPTSVRVWDAFASGRKTRGHGYFDARVSLGLAQETNKAGIKYAKLTIGVGEALPDAQLADVIAVRHQYAELVRSLALVADDYDTTGSTVTPVTNIDTDIPF